MLFSSPDYPVFLIAVFFLYGLARWGPRAAWARIAVMVLLGDVMFVLVAKDPDALWDPIGGALLRLAAGDERLWPIWIVVKWMIVPIATLGVLATRRGWIAVKLAIGAILVGLCATIAILTTDGSPIALLAKWTIGAAALLGAISIGRRRGGWIASDRGQRRIGVAAVAILAGIGATVAIATTRGRLDDVTASLVAGSHLVVLAILGIGIGAAWLSSDRPLGRVIVLFVASSLFYHAWASAMPGPYRYLLFLLLGTIVLDYYLGIWIERAEDPIRRKALVIVSLCSNLGILVVFKYADFFIQDVLQLDGEVERLNLILPAGISFHTFQSLSYTIDVYRRKLPATRSVVEFATFVLFFPQLVAGPIVRAQDLLPQLAKPPPLEHHAAITGLFRIVVGLFKKIALADTLALSIVDRVFEAPERFSSLEVACGVYAYALQIYLDFSAYSDIAIGSAQVLGFSMPENFRTPYRSANLQEFWRRWHISLSTWLRDYLYIALGGSRGAEWRTYLNLIVTMLLGGLWHGASWTFIVWGALHGFGLAVTRYFQRATAASERAAWRMFGVCAALAALGVLGLRFAADEATWTQLVILWVFATPVWAVLTAWLGRDVAASTPVVDPIAPRPPYRPLFVRDPERSPPPTPMSIAAELLRFAMCAAGIGFLVALRYCESWTWIAFALAIWALGLAADVVERAGTWRAWLLGVRALAVGVLVVYAAARDWTWIAVAFAMCTLGMANNLGETKGWRWLLAALRRTIAVVLVFHYVCLAWVFFRATSFDNALAVLRQIADATTDHANLVSIVTTALVVGFACHLFPDGSFRWLRRRFVGLPAPARGVLLAAAALVLRELAHHEIVPFIYFQF